MYRKEQQSTVKYSTEQHGTSKYSTVLYNNHSAASTSSVVKKLHAQCTSSVHGNVFSQQ